MDEKNEPQMAQKRRLRLLEVAAREFAEVGFERASLNTIIRTCRMSKSSFYYYFESKQVLFDLVIEEAAAALAKDLKAPDPASLAASDFWVRIEAFGAHVLAVSERRVWYLHLAKLFYLPDRSADASPALQRVLAEVADWLTRVLAAGRTCGAVRDDLPATLQAELVFAVLQAMDRWAMQHIQKFDDGTRQKLLAQQFAALRSLLAP